jgi:hypothetical protein
MVCFQPPLCGQVCSNTCPFLAANQVTQQMAMSNPGAGMMGPEQDPDKLFLAEAENLEVLDHQWILEGIEERLVAKFAAL